LKGPIVKFTQKRHAENCRSAFSRNCQAKKSTKFQSKSAKPLLLCVAALAFFGSYPTLPEARIDPNSICDQVAQLASESTGVPVTVLQAITRTETGRKKNGTFAPWPWTVNMEGKGVWFDTLEEARIYVFKNFKRGARSFDVGCFQINYKWHHQGFSSIDEMFDPVANALYAANFLKALYEEYGNWPDAAGGYHSRTPEHANRYKAVFEKHRAKVPQPPRNFAAKPRSSDAQLPRVNTYPLLQVSEQTARLGSLVPVRDQAHTGGFIDFNRVVTE
jgi:hypothetical protein